MSACQRARCQTWSASQAQPCHRWRNCYTGNVNATIFDRYGGADVFLDGFIAQCRVADGTFLG
ncbi:hypothetical protein DS565_28265 [Salmonella enterica subsp. enterica serovar Bareilly]|nr:hypothetical protein [Salmonella enterica subsp. enterica serovar Bareilly]